MNEIMNFRKEYIQDVISEVRQMADSGKTADQIAIFVEVALSDLRPKPEDIVAFIEFLAQEAEGKPQHIIVTDPGLVDSFKEIDIPHGWKISW